VAAIRAKAARLGAEERITILPGNALSLPRAGARFAPFDLVLADPPYEIGSGSAAAEAVLAAGWLAPGGWLSVESAARDPASAARLTVEAERDIGRARLTLMRLS
jgi:16S rRNA (guanine966-N2)-methyltransferase